MATTTRKRTTKPKTNTAEKTAEVKTEETVVVEETKPVVEKKVEKKVEQKVFDPSDGILCRSVTQGGLFMPGAKTHMVYEWVEYGDETQVEYADLAAAVRTKSSYVFGPMFIVEDDDFIREFPQLKKFYTENYSISDLEGILQMPLDKMSEEITTLPKTAIESLKVLAASSISDGTLDSVAKIKTLDELFGTNLSILAEFKE